MGSISTAKDDQVTPFLDDILSNILPQTSNFLDDIGDIEVEYIQNVNPIGETHELNDLTMWGSQGELIRYIFSTSGHFAPVVDGHEIMGVFNSPKQTAWWFWYLNNVLGGDYDVKYGTGNQTPPNDYPAAALMYSDADVDTRGDQYLNELLGG